MFIGLVHMMIMMMTNHFILVVQNLVRTRKVICEPFRLNAANVTHEDCTLCCHDE